MSSKSNLTPRLVIKGADRAISYYCEAMGAREVERYADPNLGGKIVHALLAIGDVQFSLTEEDREFHNAAPVSLGGSPVILGLELDDVDGLAERMVKLGGRVIFPVTDHFYGRREGRVEDPFGHVWILSKQIADVPREEIERRMKEVSADHLASKK